MIWLVTIGEPVPGLDKNEREVFRKEVGLTKTGLNQLIKEGTNF